MPCSSTPCSNAKSGSLHITLAHSDSHQFLQPHLFHFCSHFTAAPLSFPYSYSLPPLASSSARSQLGYHLWGIFFVTFQRLLSLGVVALLCSAHVIALWMMALIWYVIFLPLPCSLLQVEPRVREETDINALALGSCGRYVQCWWG